MYMLLKHLHMTCAMLTLISFAIRGFWMLTDNRLLQRRWVKIAPHIIDTLLLVTAVGLTITLSQYPFTDAWLTAKLGALVAYIVLGTVALKRGKTKAVRTVALLLALACWGYIFAVARSHMPFPW
nr:SirB2 family protein [Aliamphritea hakodatensis]